MGLGARRCAMCAADRRAQRRAWQAAHGLPPGPSRNGVAGFAVDRAAVTPALGAILILAITIVGIAGVLAWGAPTIDRIKSRNALLQMSSQMEDLRDAQRDLSVPDHSRFPTVDMPGGVLAIEPGTRFMLTIDHDVGSGTSTTYASTAYSFPQCDFHITNWADSGASKNQVTVGVSGCQTTISSTCTAIVSPATSACLEIHSVVGSATLKQTTSYSGGAATVTGADFSKGDWMFRLTDGYDPSPTTYAEAWLTSSDRVAWHMGSQTGSRDAYLDGNSVFTVENGAQFQQKEPVIEDGALGQGYYGFWLRTMSTTGYGSISGQGTHQVYFSLMTNTVRTDASAATRLRYDFAGAVCSGNCPLSLAEAWCKSLLLRNDRIAAAGAVYTNDSASPCTNGNSAGERSVCYARSTTTTPPSNACTVTIASCSASPTNCFQYRYIHARIYAGLSV